jgi:hypothetical protein
VSGHGGLRLGRGGRGGARPLVEVNDLPRGRRHGRRNRCRRRRLGLGGAALDQLQDLVADFRLDRAQLVLHVEAVLLAEDQEVLGLHAKLARECEDAHFFFLLLLQAKLPVVGIIQSCDLPRETVLQGVNDFTIPYSTRVAVQEKRSSRPT